MATLVVVVSAIVLLPMVARPLGSLSAERFPTPELVDAMERSGWLGGKSSADAASFSAWAL